MTAMQQTAYGRQEGSFDYSKPLRGICSVFADAAREIKQNPAKSFAHISICASIIAAFGLAGFDPSAAIDVLFNTSFSEGSGAILTGKFSASESLIAAGALMRSHYKHEYKGNNNDKQLAVDMVGNGFITTGFIALASTAVNPVIASGAIVSAVAASISMGRMYINGSLQDSCSQKTRDNVNYALLATTMVTTTALFLANPLGWVPYTLAMAGSGLAAIAYNHDKNNSKKTMQFNAAASATGIGFHALATQSVVTMVFTGWGLMRDLFNIGNYDRHASESRMKQGIKNPIVEQTQAYGSIEPEAK